MYEIGRYAPVLTEDWEVEKRWSPLFARFSSAVDLSHVRAVVEGSRPFDDQVALILADECYFVALFVSGEDYQMIGNRLDQWWLRWNGEGGTAGDWDYEIATLDELLIEVAN